MTKTLMLSRCLIGLAATLACALSPAAAPEQPLAALPYTPSLDLPSMDRSVDPCEDFYQYACGGWIKNNPIPEDQARWSVYAKMAVENQRYLWGILDKLSDPQGPRNANQARMGDYFAACMDEEAARRQGLAPLRPLLAEIEGLQDRRALPALLAKLHLATNNERLFFRFASGQDLRDAQRVIAFASAGGRSLPDREYYTRQDAKSVRLRQQLLAHMAQSFEQLGDAPAAARAQAVQVLALESALARASLSTVDKRDPYKSLHPLSAAGLQALTPGFDWAAYQQALGLDSVPPVYNVTEPAFFKAWSRLLARQPLDTLRHYLRWQLLSSQAASLSPEVVQADFDFFGQTLQGVPQLKPRWKRCVELVDAQLGEALGQEFVARNFSPALKDKTLEMTRQIEQAMAARLQSLSWMSPATRQRALEKLHAIVNKVGYPERWRDYSALQVARDDFAGNVMRGHAFELKRQLAKIGRPLERGEWSMTPQTVNAYYDAQMNDINFPAGVLQPPLYDARMDDAPNYGNTGGTIGHELIHGFDDEGRQFDARGNLRDWWQPRDAKAFERRAACVAQQYSQYVVVDEIRINSRLTLGEDLADLGGLVLAHAAWQAHVADQTLEPRDGLTPEQRFFVGFAQWDCSNARPEALRVKALTDPHSPGRYRINGVVVNMPEFERAFRCQPGAKMVKPDAQRCKVW
jgi:endothelin-converting enzyme/putative endopeptidase